MSIIKSFLNNTISMMVTRKKVLKSTNLTVADFDIQWISYCWKTHQKNLKDAQDGLGAFIKDFREEGWCHEELSSAIYTLFHLDDSLRDYAEYWF